MKTPISWLNEYVDLSGISNKEFAEKMTMSGSKVEGIECPGAELSNVVTGKILSLEPHPDAEKLSVCEVDLGSFGKKPLITGAKNVKAGDIVPVALPGASLPGGIKIESTKLRGLLSDGMMCSLVELGLNSYDAPWMSGPGVLVFEENTPLGEDVRPMFGLDDSVVEFEITSNRPDCFSILGLALEASATFSRPLQMPDTSLKGSETAEKIDDILKVEVKAPDLCPRYMARIVKDVKIGPSPKWMRERLRNAGVRPINNIVDITNYVMLEFSQPMHAFDHKHIGGGKITVRNAAEGEKIVTLDEKERVLDSSMLAICDDFGPTAVAGVMGGEHSGIDETTKMFVFESANFNPASVRITAKKLGLRSESSSRFEKGLDPNLCLKALDRACHLVELLGCGTVISGTIDVNNSDSEKKSLPLDADKINRLLGTELSESEMADILKSLKFTVEGGLVTPPSFRMDINSMADIAEEVARIYGYNNIKTSLSLGRATPGVRTERQMLEGGLSSRLCAHGLSEIVTYSFISPKAYDKIRLPSDSPMRNSVVITNPLGEDKSVMRTTMLPSILEALSHNFSHRSREAALFEIGKVYLPKSSADELPDERKIVSLGFYGGGDYYNLKGIVESALNYMGISSFEVVPVKDNPSFHPGRGASILCEGRQIGILGQVHPAASSEFEMDVPVFAAFLDFELLMELGKREKSYMPLPKFPAVTRDLALVCSEQTPSALIFSIIESKAGQLLEALELFDLYRGDKLGEGKKSLAFSLTFRAKDRTLNDEDIEKLMNEILNTLKEREIFLRK